MGHGSQSLPNQGYDQEPSISNTLCLRS